MRKLFTLILILSFVLPTVGNQLILIPTENFEETKIHFANEALVIHFYREDFLIATTRTSLPGSVLLDENPWQEGQSYYLVYTGSSTDRQSYTETINSRASILYQGEYFLIARSDEKTYGQLPPASNDGMVRIFNTESRLPSEAIIKTKDIPSNPDPAVVELLNQIDGNSISNAVQHMENYGTRDAYAMESVFAQDWIEEQFQGWGLEV